MKIRIGCCSDTHGKPLPAFESADLIVHAGDLYDFDKLPNDAHAVKIVEYIRDNRVVFVRGNHDVTDPLKLMKADLSARVAKIAPGLWLAGIGMGCAGDDAVMLPDEGHLVPLCRKVIDQAVAQFSEGDHCIVVTHYPAKVAEAAPHYRGQSTRGFFFDCVRVLCDAMQPITVIQGHTHSMNGKVLQSNGLQYAWPGPRGMMLEVDTESWDVSLTENPRPKKAKKEDVPGLFDKWADA